MKKAIAAAAVGVLLVAGQAAAANTAAVRVGDRVGAAAGESSELAGVPLPVLLVGAALIVGGVVVASDDDGDSN